MATPTILEYATQRRDKTKLAVTAAGQRLATAQAGSTAASAQLAAATSALATLEAKAADIRKKLSVIPTPADGEALLDLLEQTTIEMRAEQAKSLQAQVALTESQSEAELAQSDLAVAGAQLESDEAELKQSDEANKRRVAWVASLDGSLATMKTDATNALSVTKAEGAAFKQAKKRIGDDIPTTLLTLVEERRAAEVARITNKSVERSAATDAVEAEVDANGGLAGRAVDKWAAFQRQEAVVGEYVNTARNRFDQALATLTLVGDATRSALTPEADASIDDPALATARDAAALEEKGVDAKRIDLDTKRSVLNDAILKAKADPTNTTKQTAVTTARGDVTLAEEALGTAVAAYEASSKAVMDAWEAAVPDATWKLLEDYEGAVAVLNGLKNITPATLKTDLQAAETAYVQAQIVADNSTDVLANLIAEQAQRAAREENARQIGAASLFSSLRGDNQ
jgi:hypothetical protein